MCKTVNRQLSQSLEDCKIERIKKWVMRMCYTNLKCEKRHKCQIQLLTLFNLSKRKINPLYQKQKKEKETRKKSSSHTPMVITVSFVKAWSLTSTWSVSLYSPNQNHPIPTTLRISQHQSEIKMIKATNHVSHR
jgi:hypothetical protein